MNQKATLAELLADPTSLSPAIISVYPPVAVSYKALAEQVELLAEQLRAAGLMPGDSVALVLPNGLEFLVLFLALVRARLIAAPLNPADKSGELRNFIQSAQARAVVAQADNSAAREVAALLGLWTWSPQVDAHGVVSLTGLPQGSRNSIDPPTPSDVAVIANTSGTTSRPKTVPLTHANITCSAVNIASHYALTPSDCSLVVLPLFHGHGLIGCTLSTLASGGAVVVPLRFSASQFWKLFREHRVTWFSAVPTIHRILLARAQSDNAPHAGARFIRSCSAPLAPAILDQMEKRFGAPVIEAYGMTEAAHQVATNPLPPLARKPGSVGLGDGVSIIDDAGRHQPPNHPGEVVVRGPNVMSGYRNNAEANAAAFIDGWFRTGDIGKLDDDKYLILVGRIKELINRGGEKIAPGEIEDVLLQHPAVSEAVVLGVPDAKYGEEVAAAVVLRDNCDAARLQEFCREHLPDFKLPKFIQIVRALPKNAMGKINRHQVAAEFKSS
jgi:acyl-CoA synthetase (AMP-forming)/AMP-acid ligase II